MAQKIYNNGTDGKILMSSAGKVIRQPYEFGNGVKHNTPIPITYRLHHAVQEGGEITIIFFHRYTQTISSGFQFFNNIKGNYYMRYEGTSNVQISLGEVVGAVNLQNSINMFGYQRDANGYRHIRNSFVSKYGHSDGNYYLYNDFKGDISSSLFSATTSIYVYNRSIDAGEIQFIYNNALASKPQSDAGLLNYYVNLSPSIYDSKIVILPDFANAGSSNYIEIIGLPPGTPEVQLAYANANLFVPFLS